MLKKISRTANNKSEVVTNRRNLFSSLPSSSLCAGFPAKFYQYLDASHKSSNSIVQTMPLSVLRNLSSKKPSEFKHHPWNGRDSKPVGLGIVDALINEIAEERSSKGDHRILLSRSQLKLQIPSTSQRSIFSNRIAEFHHPKVEFCVKNKNSLIDAVLLSPARRSLLSTTGPNLEPSLLYLSVNDIEMSEDYTCVIFHGPHSKTTHIFDNCIIESHSDGFGSSRMEIRSPSDGSPGSHSEDFLTYCHACRNRIAQGKDIFMHRGEKAYCSEECLSREILLGGKNSEEALQ